MRRDWNTSSTQAPGDRVFAAIKPDVILLQEIDVADTASDLTTRLNRVVPPGAGLTWTVQFGESDGFIRCAVASRYPLTLGRDNILPLAEPRGVTVALVDLPDDRYATDLYVMGVHLKASGTESDELRRQASADAIAAWIRDIQQPGGVITLSTGTPMLIGGDTNLRSDTALSIRANATLVTGDIFDEATYGADIRPDWDATDLIDVQPRDPFNSSVLTWSSSSPSIRFDRFYYTDSVGSIPTSFIFNTSTMTSTARSGAGVLSTDTRNTTDHLPVAVDLRLPEPVITDPGSNWSIY